jgi:dihydrofolate reductase
VAIGGAETVREFLVAGFLDEIRLQVVPVLLGGGTALFDGLGPDAARLECAEAFEAGGVAHLGLRVLD